MYVRLFKLSKKKSVPLYVSSLFARDGAKSFESCHCRVIVVSFFDYLILLEYVPSINLEINAINLRLDEICYVYFVDRATWRKP